MKLTITINDEKYINSYLSILSVGILECIQKEKITTDDAMNILYFPSMISIYEKYMPNIRDAIHLGTELEDVLSIIPNKFVESINQIKEMNFSSIDFNYDGEQHVFYDLKENG